MAKFLKLFHTEDEYSDFIGTCKYIVPNVSKIEESGNIYYNKNIKLGDFLFADGTICSCLQGNKMPVAICAIDADEMEDKCYRFVSVKIQARRRFDPIVIPHDSSKVYTYYDSPLPNYAGVPTLNPETGEFDGFKQNGYTTWPGINAYYRPDRYSVEINGYKYPSPEALSAGGAPSLSYLRGYAAPAYNLDGSKNEYYWQKEFNGKLNLFMDFDGETNTKVWLETKRNLPMIQGCIEYAPGGFGEGKWYLPSSGEMALLGWITDLIEKRGSEVTVANRTYQWYEGGGISLRNFNAATSTEMGGCGINYYQTQYNFPEANYRNKYDNEYYVPFIKIPKYYPYEEPTTPIRVRYEDEGDLTMCDGYNKHVRLTEYVSRDKGKTWATTTNIIKGELIEKNSTDCGYIPPRDFSKEYFMLVPRTEGEITFQGTGMSYSVDSGETWQAVTNGEGIIVGARKEIWFKGEITPGFNSGIGTFSSTVQYAAKGNIMSLLYGDDYLNKQDLSGKPSAFLHLFKDSTNLSTTDSLYLPALTLSSKCYSGMFMGCTSLNSPVEYLSAPTLASGCYEAMFSGCTSMAWSTDIQATAITEGTCVNMYKDCSALEEIYIESTAVEEGALTNWVSGVAQSGWFYKPETLELEFGVNGIPEGWTVEKV